MADTLNTGAIEEPTFAPQITVHVPDELWPTSIWTVTWTGGLAPYTIEMDLGGGTVENVPAGTPAVSPFVVELAAITPSPDSPSTYKYTVTVTDNLGNAGSQTGSYNFPLIDGVLPRIESISYEPPVLTVVVSDVSEYDVTVSVTEPEGFTVDAVSKAVAGGNGAAVFYWSAVDVMAGASGTTEITADDGYGGTDTNSASLYIAPISIPDGALAAVPSARNATLADVVTVAVIAGDFSNPFKYVYSAGVTVESGATYANGTFNVGAVGGSQLDVDGIWTNVAPDSFLVPLDFMFQERDIGDGRVRIDFNITPIGGSETSDGGVLYNFGLKFDHAGTYVLGFEEFHDVKRTYYSDGAHNEYFWDDISNNYPDVPNSIEVREP